MKMSRTIAVFFLIWLMNVISTGPVFAGKERIAGLHVRVVTVKEIQISAKLIRWMNPDLENAIHNGIPKDILYTIVLMKRVRVIPNKKVQTIHIKHTIKYDVLEKNYKVTTWDAEGSHERVAENIEEVMDLISKINSAKMILKKSLRARHTYYVSLKAEVKESRLPFFLDYILFFIPVLELDTPWAHSSPFYSPESR